MTKTYKRKYKKKNITLKIKNKDKCLYKINPTFEKEFEKTHKSIIENNNYQNFIIKAFNTRYSPYNVSPKNDFYTYVNYAWLYFKTKKQKYFKTYYTQEDSFRVVQEKVYYQVIDLVKKYIHNNKNNISKQLDNVYSSLYNLNENSAKNHINKFVIDIKSYIEKGNLIALLANIAKNPIISIGSPIVWSIDSDQKNTNEYCNYVNYPKLSIYDYTLYIDDVADDENTKKYKKLFKKKYFEFINILFKRCVGSKYNYTAQDIWDIELEILQSMGCNQLKESTDYYNKVYKKDSIEKYDFDWEQFCMLLGYKETPDFFICSNINYLKCIMKILKTNWQSKKWEAYFVYIGAKQIIRFHKEWRYIYFDFFDKFLLGQPIPMPDTIYTIFGLSYCFDTFLTNEYVNKYKSEKNIQYTNNLIKDLLIVFHRIIERNNWLDPSTKKYALLKLINLKSVVGSPKILSVDPLLEYNKLDAWGNMELMNNWNLKYNLKLNGKKTLFNREMNNRPFIDWSEFKLVGDQAYVVNAYYSPIKNSIYLPQAFLQKPFIDTDRGIEYNLSHIGYTIAHEISHALDNYGSMYDYKGNLHNWWTKRDSKIFNRKVNNVIKQYKTFASYDGLQIDGSIGVGEDIADICGLAICTEYLRDFQVHNYDNFEIRNLSFQTFFEYIAISNRQKIYDKAIKAQLKNNPHPMNKYRTNCPLARIKLFTSLYNIKKGDEMYWYPQDTIW
jgi:predicted metalloendopeptidase